MRAYREDIVFMRNTSDKAFHGDISLFNAKLSRRRWAGTARERTLFFLAALSSGRFTRELGEAELIEIIGHARMHACAILFFRHSTNRLA